MFTGEAEIVKILSLLHRLRVSIRMLQLQAEAKTSDVTLLAVYLTAQGCSHSELKP